jgi:WD40 repeat protein
MTGAPQKRIMLQDKFVGGGIFSPDSRYIVAFDEDDQVLLFDVETEAVKQQFIGHTDMVYKAIFSSDGKHILTAANDGTARLWSVETGQELRRFIPNKVE